MDQLLPPEFGACRLELTPVDERITYLHFCVWERCLTVVCAHELNGTYKYQAFLEFLVGVLKGAPAWDSFILLGASKLIGR